MTARYAHILFVCTNDRGSNSSKRSCTQSGAVDLFTRLQARAKSLAAGQRVRVVTSGCLGLCKKGCVVSVFSKDAPAAQTWYTSVRPDDAEALFDSHVLGGAPLARLAEPDC